MKAIISALLIVAVLSGGASETASLWSGVVSSLPSCYTGLPFNLELAGGSSSYSYEARDLPSFAAIDAKKGVITGRSESAGAWPINVKITTAGKSTNKQYIINVIDTNEAKDNLWVGQTNNYYDRKVSKPLRVIAGNIGSTVVSRGDSFSYNFKTENAVGNAVFAFLNLPDGLSGDAKTGGISGAFVVPGIYTLGVETADQSGNTAEGFVTITVAEKGADIAQVSVLNKVTVSNNVPFVYNIDAVHAQQVQADKALFAALAAVNAAKAEAATRQGIFDGINVRLVAAEANADKAAAAAAKANTDRENAAARLSQTNKALNDAEDKLNLALLYQAGAQANVKKAEANLSAAQDKFNVAQKTLADAEKALQAAQADLNVKKLAEVQANTNLQNAQRDYNRANEDLNDAKNKLNAAQEAQQKAQDDVTKAQNDLSLAQQAWNQAEYQLKEATIALANAEAARQAALRVLQDATANNQRATTALGAAEWNLNQAVAALNVANAAKDAADRTSALIIANGSPQSIAKVDTTATFQNCKNTDLPRYAGSVKITAIYGDRAILATGNTILYGGCTQGRDKLAVGVTVNIQGVINPASKCIEVYTVYPASISK
jgi:hypothetical protein